jgi:hypothetical protein
MMRGIKIILKKQLFLQDKSLSQQMDNPIGDKLKTNDSFDFQSDTWNAWREKSSSIDFKTSKKGVGNGEEKLACELDIISGPGGQNSMIDLKHKILGNISVKDMTLKGGCTLGTNGCQNLRSIFRKIVFPLLSWSDKYKSSCKIAEDVWNKLQTKNGTSKISICSGIERFELCGSNLQELHNIFLHLLELKTTHTDEPAMKSEYLEDIVLNMKGESLIEILNDCVREEATYCTLIIVHKDKGWLIARDLKRIICPRITKGSPRIIYHYN